MDSKLDSKLKLCRDGKPMTTLIHGLKEWSVAVQALTAGDTILLMRKGGIREAGGQFTVPHQRVLLYPTFEHQKPHLLKPQYADQVEPVPSGWHPQTVPISAWADITHVVQVMNASAIASLLPFHIWNEQFAAERFKWKPKQPLYLLLLRVYRLPQGVEIAYQEAYGGCRSWIDLAEPIELAGSTAVLTEADYQSQVETIHRAIESASPQSVMSS